jgi:hypothetical protein
MLKEPGQVDSTNFPGGQWKHVEIDGSSAEEIAGSTAELPGARPAQNEASGRVFEQPVGLFQKKGHMLDLIDHHDGGFLGQHRFPQDTRAHAQFGAQGGIQKVEEPRPGKTLVKVGGLAGLAGTPEEGGSRAGDRVRSPGYFQGSLDVGDSFVHVLNIAKILN